MAAIKKTDAIADSMPWQYMARYENHPYPSKKKAYTPIDILPFQMREPEKGAASNDASSSDSRSKEPLEGAASISPNQTNDGTDTGNPPGGNGTNVSNINNSTTTKNNFSKNANTTIKLLITTGLLAAGSGIAHLTNVFGEKKEWAAFGLDIGTVSAGTFWLSSLLAPISTDSSSYI